jgi:hypothetical protein
LVKTESESKEKEEILAVECAEKKKLESELIETTQEDT